MKCAVTGTSFRKGDPIFVVTIIGGRSAAVVSKEVADKIPADRKSQVPSLSAGEVLFFEGVCEEKKGRIDIRRLTYSKILFSLSSEDGVRHVPERILKHLQVIIALPWAA